MAAGTSTHATITAATLTTFPNSAIRHKLTATTVIPAAHGAKIRILLAIQLSTMVRLLMVIPGAGQLNPMAASRPIRGSIAEEMLTARPARSMAASRLANITRGHHPIPNALYQHRTVDCLL
jgi:hypothetical protein